MPNNPYTRFISTPVPQNESADSRQVKNNAGGFVFTIDDKARLERFLILGTDGGTYYVSEKDLTKQNLDFLKVLIKSNEVLYWDTVRDVSVNGRSYRNSAAILATAYLFQYGAIKDTPQERFEKTAFHLGMEVIRTFTHMAELVAYFELLGGWSRQKRRFIDAWYKAKGVNGAAYQAVKYRQRDGWTHRDLFRLAHPEGVDVNVGNFILGKSPTDEQLTTIPDIIRGFVHVQAFGSIEKAKVSDVVNVLDRYPNLPWEAIPTQFLKAPDVWKMLFYHGQLKGQALVRNITRLARIGAFNDMVFAADYAARLTDPEMIAKTRLHPINYLNAQIVHTEGQVQRGNRSNFGYSGSRKQDWEAVPVIVDALNDGFHLAFKSVQPAAKRTYIALDTSGSMWWDTSMCTGLDISAATAAAAMSMTVAKTEPYYTVKAFSHEMREIAISPKMTLNQINRAMQAAGGGGTDCSLPMLDALQKRIEVDTFMIYTDNETWQGRMHPHLALQKYRDIMGIDAKLIVAGVAATDFTIADPSDRGMLDVVGFDSNAPKVMADFSAGRI